jgi:hypothetical protein
MRQALRGDRQAQERLGASAVERRRVAPRLLAVLRRGVALDGPARQAATCAAPAGAWERATGPSSTAAAKGVCPVVPAGQRRHWIRWIARGTPHCQRVGMTAAASTEHARFNRFPRWRRPRLTDRLRGDKRKPGVVRRCGGRFACVRQGRIRGGLFPSGRRLPARVRSERRLQQRSLGDLRGTLCRRLPRARLRSPVPKRHSQGQ